MIARWTPRVAIRTPDRRRSRLFFAPYEETNAGDDHGRAGREDYSVKLLAPVEPGPVIVLKPIGWRRWTSRRTGAASAAAVVTERRNGARVSPLAVATLRVHGQQVAPSETRTRRGGVMATKLAVWTERRTGGMTS